MRDEVPNASSLLSTSAELSVAMFILKLRPTEDLPLSPESLVIASRTSEIYAHELS